MRLTDLFDKFGDDHVASAVAQFLHCYFAGDAVGIGPGERDGYFSKLSWFPELGVSVEPAPIWARPHPYSLDSAWCTQEDFIEAMTALHGKDLMVRVLMALEET